MTPLPSFSEEPANNRVVVPLAPAPVPDGPREITSSALTDRTLERRWIAGSILAHAAVLAALLFGLFAARQIVPPPVLKVALVQAPGAAGAAGGGGGQDKVPALAPATAEASAAVETPPPAPQPVPAEPQALVTPPPPQVAPAPVLPAKTEVPPQVTPAPKAELPQLVMQVPPPKPTHVPPRHTAPRHRETPPQPATAAPAPPIPTPAPTLAQVTPAAAPATAGPGAGPSTQLGQGKGTEGIGKGAIGNTAGPGDDYLERLYRHLLRYKKYPPAAISAKQQGSVIIGFTISRNGSVSEALIEKSSGSPVLDQATLAMVQRASPAPALPDSFKGDTARVRFPIDYKLSLIDQIF